MKLSRLYACVASLLVFSQATALADVYELRTYTAAEGKLDKLNARFRDHTVKLFERHGIENIGYWVPTDEEKSQNTLVYIIKHKSPEAAKASWKSFLADPDWKAAAKASGVGRLENIDSVYMEETEYSPNWMSAEGEDDDVFELRVYKAAEGKLGKLDARFRDHTIGLFNKHGMKSVAYWHPTDPELAQNTLIYIIKHENADAAKASWKAFAQDPKWKAAAAASGVGKLAKRPERTYMQATDYSPMK